MINMINRGLRRRAVTFGAAIATGLLLTLVMSPAASADTMRTFNLAIWCTTGEAYGLQVNNGSGWYSPDGSSYASGGVKYFTVSIPASATRLEVEPTFCDNQDPSGEPYNGPYWEGYSSNITPGTSTISANASCLDYIYYSGLLYYCSLSSITYG